MRLTRGSNSPLAKASISSANYLHIHANPPPSYGGKSACSYAREYVPRDASVLIQSRPLFKWPAEIGEHPQREQIHAQK